MSRFLSISLLLSLAVSMPLPAKTPAKTTTAAKPKQTSPGAGDIQYLDLVAPSDAHPQSKLPYGRSFTISGKVSQVCALGTPVLDDKKTDQLDASKPCGAGGKKLTDVLAATTVGGAVVVNGQQTPFTPAAINGDAWSVTVGKLDENTAATFKFAFSGNLSPALAAAVVEQMLNSKEYSSGLDAFFKAAFSNASQTPVLAPAFGQTVATIALDLLKKQGVTPKTADDLGKRLASPSGGVYETFINIPATLASVRQYAATGRVPALTQDMPPSDLYAKLPDILQSGGLAPGAVGQDALLADFANQAKLFVADYAALGKELAADMTVNISVEVGSDASDITEDLQKYAGFDGAALYIPRLHELRGFATVNIYFKAVSLHPSAGTRDWLWERLSLTLGKAVKDLSGVDTTKSKIKGEDAFIWGLGLRLNKYFRLTAGDTIYRAQLPAVNGVASPITNKLRHEFYIGPSIDISAIPSLQKIFAKSKSE